MKKIVLLLVLSFAVINVFGQRRLKYQDIFDLIGKEPAEKSFLRLSEFQKQDPDFINTYYQLGTISWNWLQNEDPFINYNQVLDLIYNTRLYYGLAKSKMMADDKEVKRNKKLYSNIKIIPDMNILEQRDVDAHISKVLDLVAEYETNVKKIIGHYNKTVDKYNHCISSFQGIVGRQSNYKNLLMTHSKDLRAEMSDLSQSFDSVIYFFNEFKAALGNYHQYKLKDYNQNTKIIPINTYRLDGLTVSDFLQPEIPLWDYRSWVKEAFASMDGKIKNAKDNSIKEIEKMRNKVATLQAENAVTDNIREFQTQDKLLNEIEKYDYKSLITSCLEYETAKANYQLNTMRKSNHTDSLSFAEPFARKTAYYYDLYTQRKKCDNLLAVAQSRNTDNNNAKLGDFISAVYKPAERFRTNFSSDQTKDLDNIESAYLENLKAFTIDNVLGKDGQADFKGAKIPYSVSRQKISETSPSAYYTLCNEKDVFGNRYLAGYYKQSATASQGFVAKVSPAGNVTWVRNINLNATAHDCVFDIVLADNGYVLVAGSVNDAGCKSYVIKYDADGKQTSRTELPSSLIPATLSYDEVNDIVLVVLKGTEYNANQSKSEDALVVKTDIAAKSVVWQTPFTLQGSVVNVLKSESETIVVCNYRSVADKGGKKAESQVQDIATIEIDANARVAAINVLGSKSDVTAANAAKINAETINVVGIDGEKVNADGKLIYIVADKTGKIIDTVKK